MKTLIRSDLRTWADRAIEVAWQGGAAHSVSPAKLTWPVDPATLKEMKVRWPTKFNWRYQRPWGDQIASGLRRLVKLECVDIPQRHGGIIAFELIVCDRKHRVNIEVSDCAELNEEALRDCDLHFKMQYGHAGYGNQEHLLPGGFINADKVIYRFLPRLRALRDRFVDQYEVYGRFELTMDRRRKPLEILLGSDRFAFEGGEGRARYSRYLREVARSKVCIDLPGTASMTFRLFDYFAVGACIVAPPHVCRLPIPFEDGVHIAYCKEDYSDLEEKCAYYVEHEEERRRLIRNSRDFFDAYMHRDQIASYYLFHCLKLLG